MHRHLQSACVWDAGAGGDGGSRAKGGKGPAWPVNARSRHLVVRSMPGEVLLARQCGVWAPLQGSRGRILRASQHYLLGTNYVPGHVLQTLGVAALDPPAAFCATTALKCKPWGPVRTT